MKAGILPILALSLYLLLACPFTGSADSVSSNPILFVTMVPNPSDFGTLAATFSNHNGNPDTAFRGGDLWIRYTDGTLRNLTAAAGYGNAGFQGVGGIAVRDPAVNWAGNKAIFSMVIGAPTQRYQVNHYYWQLYEITGFAANETPVITKVANQPVAFNNFAPTYDSDDSIIFISDRPRDNSVLSTYPQKDEYESAISNSGVWKLNPTSGSLELLDHAPSGDFNPIIDSYGRVIFTRWDHLQRDQQNIGVDAHAFNFESETSSTRLQSAQELFPEPRDVDDPDYRSTVNLYTINQFFPWMMNQDGTGLETLNHVGRHEIGNYIDRSFNDDSNLEEFYSQYSTGANTNSFDIFLHIKEIPNSPGTYIGTNCQEFATHAAGQILTITGPPGMNPDDMTVAYITHLATAGATDSPTVNHTGLYRNPLPLTNGKILVAHTSETREDHNQGTTTNPVSRYNFRLKTLIASGRYQIAGSAVTSGINKSVSFWSPDELVSYSGPLWEMMPVEVVSRSKPASLDSTIPEIENGIFTDMGISLSELKDYLVSQDLALVVSRNLTTRDRNDHQQPMNLRVVGTSTESIPDPGKVYDISHLQFFQGDLIRGYGSSDQGGRRVIAQPMHSVGDGINPAVSGAPSGSVEIAEDGSMAAFVPARRALSWQMTDPDGKPVVRERYWLTFQPGEVRVCASCHGVNTRDQSGRTAPTNEPVALRRLLAHWKDLPIPPPPPRATPTPSGNSKSYHLRVRRPGGINPRAKFTLTATGGAASDELELMTTINGVQCSNPKLFPTNKGTSRNISGKFPGLKRAKIKFALRVIDGASDLVSRRVALSSRPSKATVNSPTAACEQLRAGLR